MIRLGLRLTLAAGREAVVRLAIIAGATALGVGLLLVTLAGVNAVNSQNARYAWLNTGAAPSSEGQSGDDPVYWHVKADEFQGKTIGRVDVAVTGPRSPTPPGMPKLPDAGQFYASPAMSKLLRSTPSAELAVRYPGKQIGVIGASALPAPNSLIIVVGHAPAELASQPDTSKVTSIATTSPSSCDNRCYDIGINASGIDLVLSVAAGALIFPVLIFIAVATRLSAARREQRFAAMRLVGATPRQISVLSAVESTVAAAIGVALGFGLFFALRPALAPIPFTGAPFYLNDLSLNLPDVLVVALGVPIAAAVTARLALRRVQISPLGVSRRVTPRSPRAYRLIPLLAGLAELWYFARNGRPPTTQGQIQAFMTGFLLTMLGLVIAGPWLTMVGARLLARRTRRPAALIASRRLADNPQAGFRAISGLIVALFVTSVATGVITSIVATTGTAGDRSPKALLVDEFDVLGSERMPQTPVDPALMTRLRAVNGVQGVTELYRSSSPVPQVLTAPAPVVRGNPPPNVQVTGPPPAGQQPPAILASCADLAKTPDLGRCAPGAQTAYVFPHFGRSLRGERTMAQSTWFAADTPVSHLAAMPPATIVVTTDGTAAATERARSLLEAAYPSALVPTTLAEIYDQQITLTKQYQQLADVVILTSLPIAGCSLAVSVVAGLAERKRPFSLLRLAGAPLGVLRRVVALESAVPLLLISAISIGVGFVATKLFLRSQLQQPLVAPGAGYYGIVVLGLAASLGLIASTLPVLRRITGPETARNE
ncbi:MAG TPA: FtsX-like permease family protein [Acidothermaceae bacterium]